MTTIMVLYGDCLYKRPLEEKQEITLGSGPKDSIQISSLEPAQVRLSLKKGFLYPKGKHLADFQSTPLPPRKPLPSIKPGRQAVCLLGGLWRPGGKKL